MAYRRMYRRTSVRRRRPVRSRRRYGMKRFGRRRVRRDYFQATSDINRGGFNFLRKKRLPYKVWAKRMFKSSDVQQKYRSNNSIPGSASAAVTPQQQNIYISAIVPDSGGGNRFWQVAGGLVTNNDTPTTTDFGGGDLFIRGGVCRICFNNNGNENVKVTTWRLKTTVNGGLPTTPFVTSQGWDPSLPDPALLSTDPNRDVYKLYKFWGAREVMLKPGESFERAEKIRAQKVDQDQWINLRSRDFWCIAVENIENITATTLNIVQSWNLSFTGDRVI